MCVCVCVCVSPHVRACMHTCVYLSVCVSLSVHVCVCVWCYKYLVKSIHFVAEVTIRWTPAQDQLGDHVICIMAVDLFLVSSTPFCIPVSVTEAAVEVSII